MAKWLTLKSNTEFRTLYYRGRSRVDPVLVTYVRKNRLGTVRIGITTGKKAGNAVQRSRCRRIIREAFRMLPPVTGGYDIVFVARGRTAECKSTRIAAVMERQLRALGVLAP